MKTLEFEAKVKIKAGALKEDSLKHVLRHYENQCLGRYPKNMKPDNIKDFLVKSIKYDKKITLMESGLGRRLMKGEHKKLRLEIFNSLENNGVKSALHGAKQLTLMSVPYLEGTSYTIDDRKEKGTKFIYNDITETVPARCWKKGGDRSETFTCESRLATKGLKAYIMKKEEAKPSGGRRLLSKVGMDWDEKWQSFVSNVWSAGDNDGVCQIADSFSNVQVDADGTYQFSCTRSTELCNCATSVGTGSTSADTQYFVNEDMGVYLGVFRDSGAAAYEICETGGECHAYGDVNDGMVARRRRRLLQSHGGGS